MGYQWFRRPVYRPGDKESPLYTETTGTTIRNYGNSLVKSTVTNRKYTLAQPTAIGIEKTLFCTQCTTALVAQVVFQNATVFANVGQGSTIHSVKFNHPNQSLSLYSLSTTRWLITGSNNSPVMSTAV